MGKIMQDLEHDPVFSVVTGDVFTAFFAQDSWWFALSAS